MANREEILKQSLRFRHTLDAMEHVIKTGNAEALEDLIRSASDARAGWQMNAGDAAHAPLSGAQRARHVHDPLPRPPAARRASPARCACRARRASPTACCCSPASPPARRDRRPARLRRHAGDARRAAQLGCRIEGERDAIARHRPRRPAAGAAGDPLPRQRRHRDAAAGRGAARSAPPRAGASSSAACRACTSGRSATWSTRCARSAARSTTSAAGLSAARVRPPPAPLELDRPIRVRGDVSSQFLTALLLALPLRAGAGRRDRRGRRRADLQALRRDHAEPAGALRHRRRTRRLAALPGRRRRTASLAGPLHRRRRRVVGVVLHRRRGDRRARRAAAHRRRRQRLDPGRHPLRRRRARDGRDDRRRAAWLEVRRGRWPLAPITLDCNHIPDAAMTLAVMALYATGPTRLRTSPAGASRRPTASPRWPPSCASSARGVVEGADCLAVTPPATLARRRDRDLRRPPHGDVRCRSPPSTARPARRRRAGAHRRPALRRQDLARLLRDACSRSPRPIPARSR